MSTELSRWERTRNWARGMWPDRNPLRRASDRVEAAIVAALMLVFLIAAPVASAAGGRWAASAAQQAEQASHSRYQVSAVLLADAPPRSYGYGTAVVKVEWTTRDGHRHTGDVSVPTGAKRGSTVRIWIGPSGSVTGPPMRDGQATGQVLAARAIAPLVVALALAAIGMLAHQVLERRRLAAWAADWRATGPRWTRQR